MTLIIRDAVQKQIAEQELQRQWHESDFRYKDKHSKEAIEAWRTREHGYAGGSIMMPNRNADWFAKGYDAAVKALGGK